MSLRHTGIWHYEFIASRGTDQWRIADEDDDVVTACASEGEAIVIVRQHNAALLASTDRYTWRY